MRKTHSLVLALLALILAHAVFAHDGEVEGEEMGGVEAQAESLCTDGSAERFPCSNVDLLASHSALPSLARPPADWARRDVLRPGRGLL